MSDHSAVPGRLTFVHKSEKCHIGYLRLKEEDRHQLPKRYDEANARSILIIPSHISRFDGSSHRHRHAVTPKLSLALSRSSALRIPRGQKTTKQRKA